MEQLALVEVQVLLSIFLVGDHLLMAVCVCVCRFIHFIHQQKVKNKKSLIQKQNNTTPEWEKKSLRVIKKPVFQSDPDPDPDVCSCSQVLNRGALSLYGSNPVCWCPDTAAERVRESRARMSRANQCETQDLICNGENRKNKYAALCWVGRIVGQETAESKSMKWPMRTTTDE